MVGFLYYTIFPQNPQGKADLPVADSPFQGRSRRRRKLRRISFTPWEKGSWLAGGTGVHPPLWSQRLFQWGQCPLCRISGPEFRVPPFLHPLWGRHPGVLWEAGRYDRTV